MGLLFLFLFALQSTAPCRDAAACRADAEAAATRGEFETFHDLAWRAVQKGKPNDPSLMLLLARAQSLSGRPGDALVMLGRLAEMHVPVDTASPDFERVRRLPGWAELEARLVSPPAAPSPAEPTPRPAAAPPVPDRASSVTAPSGAPAAPSPPSPAVPPAPAPAAPPSRAPAAETPVPSPAESEAIAFEAPPALGAFALAHDSVSRRFVVGDAAARRLLVVDEVSKHVVPYVSAASAGFYDDLTSFIVDPRRGDLWVVSAKGDGGDATSIVHKLQLVSGRGLFDAHPADSVGPVRFVDVTVTPDGTVYALDAARSRLFRVRAGSRSLDVAAQLDKARWTALTAADDHVLYAASDRGLVRIDLSSGAVQRVKSVEDLGGFASLAWRGGALVGVQRTKGASLVVRMALDGAGTRAQPRAILAASTFPIVGTLADGTFYYLRDARTIAHVRVR